jgi:MSHA biogenesis protein MshN
MSLINKMLQDLEERRSEGEVVLGLQGQLRAVPEQRRAHRAWWIVSVLLAMVAVGLGSWFWGRQTAPAAVQPQAALALKMDPDLDVRPPKPITTQAAAPAPAAPVAPAPVAAAPVATTAPAPVATAPAPVAAAPAAPAKTVSETPAAPASAPVVVAKVEPTPPAAPQPAPVVLPATMRASAPAKARPAERTTEFDVPAGVSKQMKDLTPQQRAENEYRRSVSLMQQGSTTDAMRGLEATLQTDPQHVLARQTLVGLLLEARRTDEAIRRLQDGLALDRSQPALAMMLARLQVEKGELKPAIDTLQRTLQAAGDRADYQAFLAALYQRDQRHKEAVDMYVAALRKAPQNGLWWMGMGISLQADNRLQEARDAFGRARAANSLSPELLAFVEQKLAQLR